MSATNPPTARASRRTTGARIARLAHHRTVAVTWWTVRALRSARALQGSAITGTVELPAPPDSATDSCQGIVVRVLRIGRASCLERSLVLQRWYAHFDQQIDVVVGVASGDAFRAHAWLAGTEPQSDEHYIEMLRFKPTTTKRASP